MADPPPPPPHTARTSARPVASQATAYNCRCNARADRVVSAGYGRTHSNGTTGTTICRSSSLAPRPGGRRTVCSPPGHPAASGRPGTNLVDGGGPRTARRRNDAAARPRASVAGAIELLALPEATTEGTPRTPNAGRGVVPGQSRRACPQAQTPHAPRPTRKRKRPTPHTPPALSAKTGGGPYPGRAAAGRVSRNAPRPSVTSRTARCLWIGSSVIVLIP